MQFTTKRDPHITAFAIATGTMWGIWRARFVDPEFLIFIYGMLSGIYFGILIRPLWDLLRRDDLVISKYFILLLLPPVLPICLGFVTAVISMLFHLRNDPVIQEVILPVLKGFGLSFSVVGILLKILFESPSPE